MGFQGEGVGGGVAWVKRVVILVYLTASGGQKGIKLIIKSRCITIVRTTVT